MLLLPFTLSTGKSDIPLTPQQIGGMKYQKSQGRWPSFRRTEGQEPWKWKKRTDTLRLLVLQAAE